MDELKSVHTRPGSRLKSDPVMDENRLCPSVLGDVQGDAVFTYGLSKISRLLGFSAQTRWPRGPGCQPRCTCTRFGLNL